MPLGTSDIDQWLIKHGLLAVLGVWSFRTFIAHATRIALQNCSNFRNADIYQLK